MYTQKASMGSRFGALILDGIFINIACFILIYFSYYMYILFAPFATFLYYGFCEGSAMSATLGKKICGIIVVDENGNRLNYAQAFLRSLCRVISSSILLIGFIWALFDKEGKALHDKMAKTFVAMDIPASNALQPAQQPQFIPVQQQQRTPSLRSDTMNGKPQIIGVAGEFAGKAFDILPQGIMFGRDNASCEFSFFQNTQGISRNHCKIQFNQQTKMFVIYDLGSSYGTFLGNGTKVSQGQPIAMRSGDEFYLASRLNLFRVSL